MGTVIYDNLVFDRQRKHFGTFIFIHKDEERSPDIKKQKIIPFNRIKHH